MRCNRNEQTQASVKVVAVLRTWGRSVMVRGRYYHSHIASSVSPARQQSRLPASLRTSYPHPPLRAMSAKHSETSRRSSDGPSESSSEPYQRQLQQKPGLSLHRQVSSKVRASMLCSPPFSRHTCPRAARCAGKPGGRFLVVGHLSAHRAKAAPLSSIKICCVADYANSQTQPLA